MPNPLRQFDAKTLLAFLITISAIIGTSALSITIITSNDKNVNDRASLVLNSTLPLFGTWVGTVLAYYFARENFEAATKSTVALSQISFPSTLNFLDSILVSAAITDNFFYVDDTSRKILEVKADLTAKDRKRLPILNLTTHTFEFLAYYEDIDAYATSNQDSTLADFINDPLNKNKNKPVVFIGKDVSLAKANEERKKIIDCRDIFVTENGRSDGKVIGYLSDFDIDKYSKT